MFKAEDILEGARSIRPYLVELLEPVEAKTVDQQLAELLAQAKAGHQRDVQILELLKNYKETRQWIAEFLSLQQVAKGGYQGLPSGVGRGEAPSAQKYICPERDIIWYRRTIAEPVMTCPSHGKELILVEES